MKQQDPTGFYLQFGYGYHNAAAMHHRGLYSPAEAEAWTRVHLEGMLSKVLISPM